MVVEVVWATADLPNEAAAALLTGAERERLGALRVPAERAGFLAAHVLARLVVARRAAASPEAVGWAQRCSRCGGPHGPPSVTVGGVTGPHLSLARSGVWVVVAIGPRAVGVDIEATGSRPPVDGLLGPAEQVQWDARPTGHDREDDRALLRWWVRKEAALKATGRGLHVDPRSVTVTPPWAAPAVTAWPRSMRRTALSLVDLRLDDAVVAALAVSGRRRPEVSVSRWTW